MQDAALEECRRALGCGCRGGWLAGMEAMGLSERLALALRAEPEPAGEAVLEDAGRFAGREPGMRG